MEAYFEGPEIWFFRNRGEYREFVEDSGLDEASKLKLLGSYRTSVSTEEFLRSVDYFPTPQDAGGLLIVPEEIREKLTNEVLQRTYELQLEIRKETSMVVGRPNKEQLMVALRRGHRRPDSAWEAEVRRNMVRINGQWMFPVVPSTWSLLSNDLKRESIEFKTSGIAREGINPYLELHPGENLEAVARFFAGERDHRPLLRYLQILQRKQGPGDTIVPLAKILHPFVRKQVDRYSICHGPNCFDAARNGSLGNAYTLENIPDGGTLVKELKERFRLARNGERYRPGDVLVYRNNKGVMIHAALVAGDGVVFTKNGVNKAAPYIFQERDVMEKVYFPKGGILLTVYKPLEALAPAACPYPAIAPPAEL
jgi:hypothetical protein